MSKYALKSQKYALKKANMCLKLFFNMTNLSFFNCFYHLPQDKPAVSQRILKKHVPSHSHLIAKINTEATSLYKSKSKKLPIFNISLCLIDL